jgi:hypothetical protein
MTTATPSTVTRSTEDLITLPGSTPPTPLVRSGIATNITTHAVDIKRDVAHAESDVLVELLNYDGLTARCISGRYIARLEKRAGLWRISVRRSSVDVMMTGDASGLAAPEFRGVWVLEGSRDRSHLSYVRPLQIDSTPPAVW